MPIARWWRDAEAARAVFGDALPVLPVPLVRPPRPGSPDPENAAAVIASIEQATKLALAGVAAGVVTNPIHKSTLYGVGFPYPGHTEFLAALTGADAAGDDAGEPRPAGGAGHRACLTAPHA